MSTTLVITGAHGRMGSMLCRLAVTDAELTVRAAVSRSGTEEAVPGVTLVPTLEAALSGEPVQVVIDFTAPEATMEHARLCAARKVAMVVGTTGFNAAQRAELSRSSKVIPMVIAPNTSVGVNVMMVMAQKLARALGPHFDAELVELHHRHKKDAPSGTALALARGVAEALGYGEPALRRTRDGVIGERPEKEVGVQSLRGGDVVGEHTVFFLGEGERIELTHRATKRDTFAVGALRAAKWVVGRPPAQYGMNDVLGLEAP
jgi:4-hydroxy-tetrahydrodipicolinate reductase